MKYTYEIIKHDLTQSETLVRTDENGVVAFIPCDPSNSDYQAYLNPEAALSTPIVDETTSK